MSILGVGFGWWCSVLSVGVRLFLASDCECDAVSFAVGDPSAVFASAHTISISVVEDSFAAFDDGHPVHFSFPHPCEVVSQDGVVGSCVLDDLHVRVISVSYTHLTLPTKRIV